MTAFVPIMLFGWVFVAIILFRHLQPHKAVMAVVIGGWLFLPTVAYNFPGFPGYSKSTAIALGLILGGRLSCSRQSVNFSWKIYDLPVLVWCFSPVLTSMANGLGLHDGLSVSWGHLVGWLVPYLSGRIYFTDQSKLRDLCLGVVGWGIVYAFLCLYEVKMSPELNRIIYGFFPHQWIQHKRYGGWRPIVFMQHGLMVSLWMANVTTITFWLWRSRIISHVRGVPISIVTMFLIIVTILCKSANSWCFMAIGMAGYVFRAKRRMLLFLILSVPVYMILRASGLLAAESVRLLAASIFDVERVGSLGFRLLQEDLFIQRAFESLLLGWGGFSRGWPIDPDTGVIMIKAVDAFWIISLSSKGLIGVIASFATLLVGPWVVLKEMKKHNGYNGLGVEAIALSLIVICFAIDCLVNGMVSPIYILISGALVGCYNGSGTEQEDLVIS